MSVLAIEDCLISKLPNLFKSSHVMEMSQQDLKSLAGETEDSAAERKRLETKRGVLVTGLEALKRFHKRKLVNSPTQKQSASGREPMSTTTPNRSEDASLGSNSTDETAPRQVLTPVYSHSPGTVSLRHTTNEWLPNEGSVGEADFDWAVPTKKAKKKASHWIVEDEPVAIEVAWP